MDEAEEQRAPAPEFGHDARLEAFDSFWDERNQFAFPEEYVSEDAAAELARPWLEHPSMDGKPGQAGFFSTKKNSVTFATTKDVIPNNKSIPASSKSLISISEDTKEERSQLEVDQDLLAQESEKLRAALNEAKEKEVAEAAKKVVVPGLVPDLNELLYEYTTRYLTLDAKCIERLKQQLLKPRSFIEGIQRNTTILNRIDAHWANGGFRADVDNSNIDSVSDEQTAIENYQKARLPIAQNIAILCRKEQLFLPKLEDRFSEAAVHSLIVETFKDLLVDKKVYENQEMIGLTAQIANCISCKVEKLGYPRYKTITNVILGENRGQNLQTDTQCNWDRTADKEAYSAMLVSMQFITTRLGL